MDTGISTDAVPKGMCGYDEVMCAIHGDRPDVPPVAIFTQSATSGMMTACGVYWPEANDDPVLMARLGCAQADVFGFPTARVPFDITAEATRLGCTTDGGAIDVQPSITDRPRIIDPFSDALPGIGMLPSPEEFVSQGRPRTVLESLELCSGREDLVVCGGLLGPMTLMSQLVGAENLILSTLLEPRWVDGWCDALSILQSEYARRQSESGADVITIVEAMASSDILDPSMYMQLSGRHMDGLGPNGGAATILHICGDTTPILHDIVGTGTDAFLPDPGMDPYAVVDSLEGRMATIGAVDPVRTLLFGGPSDVIDDARRYQGAGFSIIAPGCGLAPRTPDENLHALSHSLDKNDISPRG